MRRGAEEGSASRRDRARRSPRAGSLWDRAGGWACRPRRGMQSLAAGHAGGRACTAPACGPAMAAGRAGMITGVVD